MPIEKFVRIKNIGQFVNCVQKEKDSSLKKYNLIFGENGRGKTTLCAVLRSLQDGNHEHITERITIPSNSKVPEVVINFDAENIVFENQSWTKKIPEIVIFDSTFIARNIYSGESVTGGHRTNLLQVIVGETGVSLMRDIEKWTESISRKNFELEEIEEKIDLDFTDLTPFKHLMPVTDFKDFLELDNIPDIDSKIAEKEIELTAPMSMFGSGNIFAQPEFAHVIAPTLPSDFNTVIAKTPDSISTDVDVNLMEQFKQHGMDEDGQAWISKGLDWVHDDCCPFCGQNIKGAPLVSFYKQFFFASCSELIDKINNLQQKITNEMGEGALEKLGTVFADNNNGLQFWKPVAPIELAEVDYDMLIAEPIRVLREAALSLIESKRKSLLTAVPVGDEFRTASLKYDEVTVYMKAYNDQVATMNTFIRNQKEKIKEVDIITTTQEMFHLQLVKHRYNTRNSQLCSKYKNLQSEKDVLEQEKEAAKANLNEHGVTTINPYQDTINEYLEKFGVNFSITNSKQENGGDASAASYQILINEHPIDLGNDHSSIGKPCFRTALSAGDRSTLALAFFLTQLHHNPRKKNCVVIFDDPVGSFDYFRRERTAELLKKCGEESAQVLVFSHDPYFLQRVYLKLPPNADLCFLQLCCAQNNTTEIKEWDIEREVQSNYFKDHAILKSYLENGDMTRDPIDIARKIRPVLERHLYYRWPNQFASNDTLGTIIGKARKFPKGSPVHLILNELTDINDFARQYHHSDSEKIGEERLPHITLKSYVRRALDIICS